VTALQLQQKRWKTDGGVWCWNRTVKTIKKHKVMVDVLTEQITEIDNEFSAAETKMHTGTKLIFATIILPSPDDILMEESTL
jgi:hypothetical protein